MYRHPTPLHKPLALAMGFLTRDLIKNDKCFAKCRLCKTFLIGR